MKKATLSLIFTLFLRYSLANDINILTFGAVSDGKVDNTIIIQKAIDECAASGGGTVYFPSGKYLAGSLVLKSR